MTTSQNTTLPYVPLVYPGRILAAWYSDWCDRYAYMASDALVQRDIPLAITYADLSHACGESWKGLRDWTGEDYVLEENADPWSWD